MIMFSKLFSIANTYRLLTTEKNLIYYSELDHTQRDPLILIRYKSASVKNEDRQQS